MHAESNQLNGRFRSNWQIDSQEIAGLKILVKNLWGGIN